MNANMRRLVVFGAIFIILLGIALWQGRPPAPPPTQSNVTSTPAVLAEADWLFTSFTVRDIQAMRLTNPRADQIFVLTRAEDGTWTAPDLEGDLDTDVASQIARTMVILPYSETVAITDETSFDEFGLVPANPLAIFVEILLTDGTGHAFVVGSPTPLQDGYYVTVDERDVIYVVEPRAVEFLRIQLRTPPVA